MHATVGGHEGEPWSLGHILGGQSGAGRLPAELLFSDRDFTDADYETLLALDDSIVKKGATAGCSSAKLSAIGRYHAEHLPWQPWQLWLCWLDLL